MLLLEDKHPSVPRAKVHLKNLMDACIWNVQCVSINGAGCVVSMWTPCFTKAKAGVLFAR